MFFAGAGVGFMFLMLSRAIPWFSAGYPEMAMGRPVELHPGIFPDLLATAVMHMTLAIAYAFALAPCIYRFSLAPALAVGALAGLGLYALNFLVFQFFIVPTAFSEISTAVVHVIYALFFTSVYKAFSVPKVANSIRE